jgi:chemotaxis-related protein WspD
MNHHLTENDEAANTHRARASEFFDRPPPQGYLEEWSKRLAAADEETARELVSLVIFRLNHEVLSVRISALVEVTLPQPVHVLPHRSNKVLLGLVNIRGQLRLCVSLHGLLGIDEATQAVTPNGENPKALESTRRLLILQDRSDSWVFPVEEVLAVHRLDFSEARAVPATLGKGSSISSDVFDWKGITVGLLDEPRLFASLRSSCS